MTFNAVVMSVAVLLIFCAFAGLIAWVDHTQPKSPKSL
jgi:hypothetical protein